MTVVEMSISINRPLDEVFAVLTTPEDTPKWSGNAVEEQMTSPGPVGVGSTRRAVVRTFGGRTMVNETVVTVFEPGRRVAMRTTSAAVPFEAEWAFTPLPGGTRVDWRWSFELAGVAKLAGPVVAALFRRALRRDLLRLKQMMEAGDL